MLRNVRFASRMASHFSHERSIQVLHLGNKIIFDVPLVFENSIIIKDTRVDGGRLIINAIKRLDVEIEEQKKLA